MITVISMSRRPELYRNFVLSLEKKMGFLIDQYLVFVNDPITLPFYKNLEISNSKVKIQQAPEDFVYKYGHDTVYNYLDNLSKSPWNLKLFDTDEVDVDPDLLETELSSNQYDVIGIETLMERGDVWETKYQLYRNGILKWFGLVHENQHFIKERPATYISKALKVLHKNALDIESKSLTKNEQGFIVLQPTVENSDSDKRNLLYETLTWKIVHENGRHDNREWFIRHYGFNKALIDAYYSRAKKKFKL